MAINNMFPGERPADARRIVSNVLIAVAAVCALNSIPLLLNNHDSDGGGAHATVFVLTAGLAIAVVVAATLMKRIPFRQVPGRAMTDEEILAELEAQFKDEEPGPI